MKFFLPHTRSPENAAILYDGIKKFAASQTWHLSDRRIYRLQYRYGKKTNDSVVGQPDPINGETVFAIFEGNAYVICTTSRGTLRGEPILVGKDEEIAVEDFEA